jgi:hypothetical protein
MTSHCSLKSISNDGSSVASHLDAGTTHRVFGGLGDLLRTSRIIFRFVELSLSVMLDMPKVLMVMSSVPCRERLSFNMDAKLLAGISRH